MSVFIFFKDLELFFLIAKDKFLFLPLSWPCYQSCDLATEEVQPKAVDSDAYITGFGLCG